MFLEEKKYTKFPHLQKFIMFGGQHTEEGEKYLYETPDVYEEVLLWNVFFLMRTKLGGIEKIHKVDGR